MFSDSSFDESQWVNHIRQALDEEHEEDNETPVTIFGVPKALMMSDPDSYIPQQVAIGPFHHFRPELYVMVRYKLAAARRNHKEFHKVKLQDLVDHLMKLELRIRASYHRPLGFGGEALAWMMAVDASFLFEFLQVCGVKEGKVLTKIPSRLAHLIDLSGNKTAHNAILRDIIMLENQIPLVVMRMLLEFQFPSLDLADQVLLDMLIGLSKELSPFKMAESSQTLAVKERAHLLDFLYNFIVPKSDQQVPSVAVDIDGVVEDDGEHERVEKGDSFEKPSHSKQLHDIAPSRMFSNLAERPLEWIKCMLFPRALRVIVKLPWTILSKIPVVSALTAPIENMLSAWNDGRGKKEDEESSSNCNDIRNKPPLQEEIAIPSVTQLFEAGVRFSPTNGGISSINFDPKTLTFYIPIVKLDVNSEVVMRNLVAYEACSASGPLILTRYTELMNGIIDTDADAKLLCRRGIIVNHLKSEKEVADLWNGMSRSVRLTKVPSLDRVIADVNRYYNGRWKVKFGKFMKENVFGSWRILTFLAAIMVLLLMCLQAFCQVYSCSRILPIKALEPTVNNS